MDYFVESNTTSRLKPVNQIIPHRETLQNKTWSILGPVLYLLLTADIPVRKSTTLITFADDTAIFSVNNNLTKATVNLQLTFNNILEWTKKWRIKINKLKSVHVTYTLKKSTTNLWELIKALFFTKAQLNIWAWSLMHILPGRIIFGLSEWN